MRLMNKKELADHFPTVDFKWDRLEIFSELEFFTLEFNKSISRFQLIGTDFYFYPGAKRITRTHLPDLSQSWRYSQYNGYSLIYSFKQVFEGCPQHIQEKLLYHMDLF